MGLNGKTENQIEILIEVATFYEEQKIIKPGTLTTETKEMVEKRGLQISQTRKKKQQSTSK